jgi:hypothetical protein
MHQMDGPRKKLQQKTWDTNGDGILQKAEADSWYLYGDGVEITVDNSKIDWSGLEMSKDLKVGKNFGIETHAAFMDLPYETASTYGGTSFQKTGPHTAKVLDQKYHYELRPNSSLKNVVRNVMNEIGKPGGQNYTREGVPPVTGKPYMIHYINPTIMFR